MTDNTQEKSYNDPKPEIMTIPGNETPFIIVRGENGSQSVIPLDRYLDKPIYQSTNIPLASIESFTRYVNEYKRDQTKIFHNEREFRVFFDYYKPGETSRQREEAYMPLKFTDKLCTWEDNEGFVFTQEQFALFLDKNIADINSPSPANMLKAIQHIEGTTKVSFASKVDIENGNNIIFYEEQSDSKGKGKLSIPSEFKIVIPIYECQDVHYAISGKIRPKTHKDGHVTFTYQLNNLKEAKREALNAIVAEVLEKTEIASLQTTN